MTIRLAESRALTALQLTPLIDMVFLLLIFFLVATRFADEDRELDVNLPSASQAQPLIAESRELFLNIDAEGRYFIDGQLAAAEDLESALGAAQSAQLSVETVVLRADRRCAWDAVAVAINACHAVGLHDIRPTTSGDVDE